MKSRMWVFPKQDLWTMSNCFNALMYKAASSILSVPANASYTRSAKRSDFAESSLPCCQLRAVLEMFISNQWKTPPLLELLRNLAGNPREYLGFQEEYSDQAHRASTQWFFLPHCGTVLACISSGLQYSLSPHCICCFVIVGREYRFLIKVGLFGSSHGSQSKQKEYLEEVDCFPRRFNISLIYTLNS